MIPIRFGSPERQLFGIYHEPGNQLQQSRPAVILCNAFGQEAIRAHRFQRLLAERLAQAGHAVLRFDYFGTGDSLGNDDDGDLEGWSHDVLTAHLELERRASASSIVWCGMRLGGSLVLKAAHHVPARLIRLILWDPVLDGMRYLADLRVRHVAELERVYNIPLKPEPRQLARQPHYYRDEAVGFALSPTLREQLTAMTVDAHEWPLAQSDIVVLTNPANADDKDLKQVCAQQPGRVRTITVEHDIDWSSDAANNNVLVPTQALMTLMQIAGEAA